MHADGTTADGGAQPGADRYDWELAAAMLARGSGVGYAARAIGCHRTTVWRALRGSEAFRRRIAELRADYVTEAAAPLDRIRDEVVAAIRHEVALGNVRVLLWLADRLGLVSPDYLGLAALDAAGAGAPADAGACAPVPAGDPVMPPGAEAGAAAAAPGAAVAESPDAVPSADAGDPVPCEPAASPPAGQCAATGAVEAAGAAEPAAMPAVAESPDSVPASDAGDPAPSGAGAGGSSAPPAAIAGAEAVKAAEGRDAAAACVGNGGSGGGGSRLATGGLASGGHGRRDAIPPGAAPTLAEALAEVRAVLATARPGRRAPARTRRRDATAGVRVAGVANDADVASCRDGPPSGSLAPAHAGCAGAPGPAGGGPLSRPAARPGSGPSGVP